MSDATGRMHPGRSLANALRQWRHRGHLPRKGSEETICERLAKQLGANLMYRKESSDALTQPASTLFSCTDAIPSKRRARSSGIWIVKLVIGLLDSIVSTQRAGRVQQAASGCHPAPHSEDVKPDLDADAGGDGFVVFGARGELPLLERLNRLLIQILFNAFLNANLARLSF
jgi:hypothetical protein